MKQKWQLIIDGGYSPSFNMAADSYLMKQVTPHSLPVLRLYQWNQPTLSIGNNQKLETLGLQEGSPIRPVIIRRMTGGQAVLHGSDLTYSMTAQSTLFGGVLETYRSLASAFVQFFTNLGLTPNIVQPSRRKRIQSAGAACFTAVSSYELTIGGKKIIGSAQRQTSKAFLQHGSIPLHSQNLDDLFIAKAGMTYQDQMTSLEEQNCLLNQNIDSLQQNMIDVFQKTFNIDFEQKLWTPQDLQSIEQEQEEFPELPFEKYLELVQNRILIVGGD